MYNESAVKTFEAGAAIAQFLRVDLSAPGVVSVAGDSVAGLGTMERPSFASGDDAPVRLRTAMGTQTMIAASVITAGDEVFAAAGGKIDDTGTVSLGHALTSAGADGDQVEVLRS